MFQCSLDDGAAQKNRIVFSAVDVIHTPITLLGMLRCSLDIFVTQNASVVSNPRWHFYASHEACRRMAVYISQLTGNRTRPASREACCRAAVIQRPSRMSHWHPARPWRAVRGCRGHPLLYGEGFVLAEEGGVFGEKGTDEGGKELVHLLGTAARVESRIK